MANETYMFTGTPVELDPVAKDVATDAFRYIAWETYPQKTNSAERCSLGVGCDEAGVCYAAAHDQADKCGKPDPLLTDAGVQDRFKHPSYGKRYVAIRSDWNADDFFTHLNGMLEQFGVATYETESEARVANIHCPIDFSVLSLTLEGPRDV